MSESEEREDSVEDQPSDEQLHREPDAEVEETASEEDGEMAETTMDAQSEVEGGRVDTRWADETQLPVLKRALESLVFVSDRIVTHVQLARLLRAKPAQVRQILGELVDESENRGVQLVEVSGGYQYRTAPACASFVREVVSQKPVRLIRAQLETLALIAYRQPMTRPEVDDVRGIDTSSAIKVLLDRGLIKMLGRKDEAGRPMLYGTTPYFLEFFGLKSLKDLPTLKEFTDLSEDSRALFKRKTGESVDQTMPPLSDVDISEESELDWSDEDDDPPTFDGDEETTAAGAAEAADRVPAAGDGWSGEDQEVSMDEGEVVPDPESEGEAVEGESIFASDMESEEGDEIGGDKTGSEESVDVAEKDTKSDSSD